MRGSFGRERETETEREREREREMVGKVATLTYKVFIVFISLQFHKIFIFYAQFFQHCFCVSVLK